MEDKKLVINRVTDASKVPYTLLLLADPSMDCIRQYIHRGQCYVATIEDAVVGVYVLLTTKLYTMEIMNIAVKEDLQGKGIGKRLLCDAIERVRGIEGVKILEIGTANSSLSQLGLYQRYGFRITGVERDFFLRHYKEKLSENGIRCLDMIRLSMDLRATS